MLTLPRPPRTTRPLVSPGAIMLISCYELGHQPLSLASPAAVLSAAGFDPALNDTAVDPLDEAAASTARLIAIAVPMHTALRLGARIATRVRRLNPTAHICFYGLYATLNAAYLLEHGGDSVISGEYERPLLDLAHALDRGEDGPIPGVGTRAAAASPVLERAPFTTPARNALPPLRRYAGLEREGIIVPAGHVEATRGCHHTCRHCPLTPIYAGRFFVVPREMVLADIAAQIEAGARHITFGDPDFFNGPGHGIRICRELHAAFPGVSFDVTIKVEHLLQHRRLLPELANLGCAFIVTAVESLNDDVLRALAKG
ncbi:MAG: radical SAM protein, partial [Chloroflexota bacterium]|nr:radical SAM protein [Chloroflexota bacterium]